MSRSKHIPGPMTIEPTGQDGGNDKLMILHPDPNDFQTIRTLGRLFCYATEEQNIANAERVAKCWNSHDALLEACKAVKQCLELIDDGSGKITSGCVFQQLQAAIAQAEKEE